jgi:short-subunit dehydrogenase
VTRAAALVTGASSGIGEAFARALAPRGAPLVLVARRRDRLEALAEALPGEAVVVPEDLASAGAAGRVMSAVEGAGLHVDLLVNNAGLGHCGPFAEADPGRIAEILAVNCSAVAELTRRALPGMLERGSGRILNVVSMSAFQPVPWLSTYAASKAFVLSLSEGLMGELEGTGVRVQALCPGLVPTGFQATAGTDRVPFNDSPSWTADQVVAASLAALDRGGGTLIPAWRDRASVLAQRLAPRGLVRRVAGGLFRTR